jgi:tetrahydromethanopterin S-methyltransferase subunit B
MDVYTLFAITMVVTAVLAMVLALFYLQHARREVMLAMQAIGSMVDASTANDKLHNAMRQALAERIRNLETYRVHHSNRLNEFEDLLSLFNEDAGRLGIEPSSVLQPFEVEINDHPESELFDSSISDVELYGVLRDERIENGTMTAPYAMIPCDANGTPLDTTVVTEEPLTDAERERLDCVRRDFIKHLRAMQAG